MVIILTLSTILAVILAWSAHEVRPDWTQVIPQTGLGIAFLIAFMGWMPAPLDLAIWQSLWAVEKKQLNPDLSEQQVRLDFNIGYLATVVIGLSFILLGGLVMFDQGEEFSNQGAVFASQLINMYTDSLGSSAKGFIGLAALTTMFSTSLTTLDGSPRVMAKISELLFPRAYRLNYMNWLVILVIGSVAVYLGLTDQMGTLIAIGTILSFVSAPFYAIVIYKLVNGTSMAEEHRPGIVIRTLSVLSILLLIGFSLWYLSIL